MKIEKNVAKCYVWCVLLYACETVTTYIVKQDKLEYEVREAV